MRDNTELAITTVVFPLIWYCGTGMSSRVYTRSFLYFFTGDQSYYSTYHVQHTLLYWLYIVDDEPTPARIK